uniref:Protein kinase domain-containing protein n=1 Tax=Schistocephalus solidus TaxID=70667 RepID=A0A183T373_SCHSO
MFDKSAPFSAFSKLHFRIARESTSQGLLVFIHDLSSNGTFLNEAKIGIDDLFNYCCKGRKQPLNNNDEIALAIKSLKYLTSVQTEFPPEVTSKYTVCRRLGRGACGEVRLVFGRESCQKYAMKIVQKKTFSFLAKANDPCIVRIFDVIDTDDALYMILELVEHGELFDRVVNLGQLSEDDSKFIFLQIVLATKYLHDNGITHRDLKPENILLSGPSNRCLIKVTDFGLSKFVDGNTMLRTFCGTPTYLAPEVLLTAGCGVYTSSIDVWSLGVILLVGYPPFTDEREDFELQQQIIGGHFDFPERFWSGISESAKDLIRQLLTVNPSNRISLKATLEHPWLSDPVIRKEVSDLMSAAGFDSGLIEGDQGSLLSAAPSVKLNGVAGCDVNSTVDENSTTNDTTPSPTHLANGDANSLLKNPSSEEEKEEEEEENGDDDD